MNQLDIKLSDLIVKADLECFATKKDLTELEQRMDGKFGQVVDDLDSIQGKLDKLLNGRTA